jgi:hypothetical protein
MEKRLEGLRDLVMAARFVGAPLSGCVDWAVEALDDGPEDLGLRALASLDRGNEEAIRLKAKDLLDDFGNDEPVDDSPDFWAGRYLAHLAHGYFEGSLPLPALCESIDGLDRRLGSPDWLAILKRSSDFCADIPAYREPFEAELKYLSRLWSHAGNLSEFKNAYDYRISSKHDLR